MTKTLTIMEAANVLGVSDKNIRRWMESGKLSAEKIDRKWFVHVNLDIAFYRRRHHGIPTPISVRTMSNASLGWPARTEP